MSNDVNNTAIRSAAPQSSVFITLYIAYRGRSPVLIAVYKSKKSVDGARHVYLPIC